MQNLKCPECGNSMPNPKYSKDGCYICAYKPHGEDGGVCGAFMGCECSKCNTILEEDRFGLRNGVYECKKCGTPQWGYTEWKKDRARVEALLSSFMGQMNGLRSEFSNIENKYRF